MRRNGGGAFRVTICRRIVAHMIAELMTQPDWLRVVVVIVPRLMRQRWVKGYTFVV